MQRIEQKNIGRKFVWLTAGCAAAVLATVSIVQCFKKHEINFLDTSVMQYDDRNEEESCGRSEICMLSRDSTELTVRYVLRRGFSYPYAGVLIDLKDREGRYFDGTRFNVLKIRMSSSKLSDCKIYLTLFDKNVTKSRAPLTERYLQKDLVLSSVPRTFSLRFNEFKTPEWWFQKNNVTLNDVAPVDFSKIMALKIESGSTAKTGVVDTFTISEMHIVKRAEWYVFALTGFFLLLFIGGAFFRSAPRKEAGPVIITYDKKDIRSYRDIDTQRISDYLAKHFSEPDISIITTGSELGLSQKKIARIMNEEFRMSFKQYLTSIRIHEAKRLLLETDRLVLDIALEVGFNNISHFNRVFKTSVGLSPLEFRSKTALNQNS